VEGQWQRRRANGESFFAEDGGEEEAVGLEGTASLHHSAGEVVGPMQAEASDSEVEALLGHVLKEGLLLSGDKLAIARG